MRLPDAIVYVANQRENMNTKLQRIIEQITEVNKKDPVLLLLLGETTKTCEMDGSYGNKISPQE